MAEAAAGALTRRVAPQDPSRRQRPRPTGPAQPCLSLTCAEGRNKRGARDPTRSRSAPARQSGTAEPGGSCSSRQAERRADSRLVVRLMRGSVRLRVLGSGTSPPAPLEMPTAMVAEVRAARSTASANSSSSGIPDDLLVSASLAHRKISCRSATSFRRTDRNRLALDAPQHGRSASRCPPRHRRQPARSAPIAGPDTRVHPSGSRIGAPFTPRDHPTHQLAIDPRPLSSTGRGDVLEHRQLECRELDRASVARAIDGPSCVPRARRSTRETRADLEGRHDMRLSAKTGVARTHPAPSLVVPARCWRLATSAASPQTQDPLSTSCNFPHHPWMSHTMNRFAT